MNCRYLESPSRNFCILASARITDPRDGREKIVLSNFVSGGTGTLIFIDTRNGDGEQLELPGDEGAWAILCLNNEKLLVGTCGLKGYLHCLDLKSRTWAEPLRENNESYIWNLILGSDGMVYGGTYPGCFLLRYNPEKHILENLGRMSPYESNLYSRIVFEGTPGRIFVNCGYEKPHVAVWDMETEKIQYYSTEDAGNCELGKDYIRIVPGEEMDVYDTAVLEYFVRSMKPSGLKSLKLDEYYPIAEYYSKWITYRDKWLPQGTGAVLTFLNGDIAGVRGQQFFIFTSKDTELKLKSIPAKAPPTQILTVTASTDGKLWGSSNFGQTIFSYDPADGSIWNSSNVCNNGGEVYGMQFIKGKLFMSAYAGGDHIVYDPSKPWSQTDNKNPVTLKPAGPDMIRPHAGSTVGPDGAFWTGWVAKYGVYGGGLSRVDADTHEVGIWYDPIPEQAIQSISAGEKYLYFTTFGQGNGLKTKKGPFYLGVWDVSGKLSEKIQFPADVNPGNVEIIGDYGIVSVEGGLRIFKCDTMEFVDSIGLPGTCSCIIKYNNELAAVFSGKEMFFVNPRKGEARPGAKLPGIVRTAAVNDQGEIFFVNLERLYKLEG